MNEMESEAARLSKMRDRLEAGLMKMDEAYVNGSTEHRLPHVANISFKYVNLSLCSAYLFDFYTL